MPHCCQCDRAYIAELLYIITKHIGLIRRKRAIREPFTRPYCYYLTSEYKYTLNAFLSIETLQIKKIQNIKYLT